MTCPGGRTVNPLQTPRHRHFQPLVHRFIQSNACVPFLVGVLHYYSYVQCMDGPAGGDGVHPGPWQTPADPWAQIRKLFTRKKNEVY